MPSKPLPKNRETLKLMLECTTNVLKHLEPLGQQLNFESRLMKKLESGDFNSLSLFGKVHEALQNHVAGGGPDSYLLRGYLDLSGMPALPAKLDKAWVAVERRIGTSDE